MRIKLTLSYNGTHYLGSQTQTETKNTILGNVEQVLKKLGIQERVIASGRTDKGVHATAQVCHLDLPPFWQDLIKLRRVMNEMLPSSIMVRKISQVSSEFHARYSAKKRIYRYIIKQGASNPFEADSITFLKTINRKDIEKKIKLFEGIHDFSAFMKTGSDTGSSVREIYKTFAYEHKGYLILNFQANGFLRSQIRLMVGALLSLDEKTIVEKLEAKVKHPLRPAPANGLYLARIDY